MYSFVSFFLLIYIFLGNVFAMNIAIVADMALHKDIYDMIQFERILKHR